jgi:hypothetical protein
MVSTASLRRFARFLFLAAFSYVGTVMAQNPPPGFNYDEAKVPAYTLPDPLTCLDGTKVTTVEHWKNKRRPELLRLFAEQVYGKIPAAALAAKPVFVVRDVSTNALGGLAVRKQITAWFKPDRTGPKMEILLYLPAGAKGPVPAFLGLNFSGNHTTQPDPGIKLADGWIPNGPRSGITNNVATDASRGTVTNQWPAEKLVRRGYALATLYAGDLFPDHKDGLTNSIIPLFFKPGQTAPAPDEWNALAAWGWGLSRTLDYLEIDPAIDAKHVAVMGFSRMGKAALWAGARDERFAIVISNESGEGGAALARRWFGETTTRINTSFPHWFCGNFKQYNDRESTMPTDQHELVALIAPRPVYVASAEEDRWSDPKGEFLGAKGAEPVYALFGKKGLGVGEQPPLNTPVGDVIGYHVRTGKHDVLEYDWDQYLNFADRHFGKK